jgi:hypothetical protein
LHRGQYSIGSSAGSLELFEADSAAGFSMRIEDSIGDSSDASVTIMTTCGARLWLSSSVFLLLALLFY